MRVWSPIARVGGATIAFWVLALVAATRYLILGRHSWFYLDEWDFVVSRSAGNAGDLLRPHNQHWTTVPILAWRVLWQFAGLRSYFAYQALSVGLHVIVAALVRAIIRRAGVGPWIATGAAGTLLFFGAGAQNILSAFQITFTGALAFGFAQLLLADHAGPLDHRDALGLVAGLLAIMCSGVGVTLVVAVGLATWLRRGPRIAAFHTLPLFGIYAAWYLGFARSSSSFTGSVGRVGAFARSGIWATFSALGQSGGSGALLAVVLVAGLALLWRTTDAATRRSRFAIPAALLTGAVVFFVTAAVGHIAGPGVVELPAESRYLYVCAALVLPVLAVAIDALARRSRLLGGLAIALLLIGIPGNLGQASDFAAIPGPPRIGLPVRDPLDHADPVGCRRAGISTPGSGGRAIGHAGMAARRGRSRSAANPAAPGRQAPRRGPAAALIDGDRHRSGPAVRSADGAGRSSPRGGRKDRHRRRRGDRDVGMADRPARSRELRKRDLPLEPAGSRPRPDPRSAHGAHRTPTRAPRSSLLTEGALARRARRRTAVLWARSTPA